MVSALVSGSCGPGSSPGRGPCVVFLGKPLNSHCAPLYPGVYSCFEKGCPTKPYATMPKGIMGNGGSWSLIEALGVSVT